jgi:hypothetical protein
MDIVYAVNSESQDLRWGDPSTGNLANVVSLGFSCFQVAVMADQRYVYVTGTKHYPTDPPNLRYAWLAVVDTCTNTVTKELNLGVGYGGQCAVPPGVDGTLAFVAISRASGNDPATLDTGPHGGSNRVEALNITNPADPVLSPPAVSIPGTRYGTLWIVWSNAKSLLYTSHRGDSHIFAFPPTRMTPAMQVISNIGQQPTGLAIDNQGLTLYVGRRLAGDILSYELVPQPPAPSTTYSLANGVSQNAIYVVVDRFNNILATSNRPNDGNVYAIDPAQPQQIIQIDTQGTFLGKPAVTPDGSRAYVPRGGQNDLAQIDLVNDVLLPGFIGVGNRPTDSAIVNHTAGQRLEATPARLAMGCNAPQEVTVRAFDACRNELQGVSVSALPSSLAVSVTPSNQVTPARYQVECLQGGSHSVTFAETNFPYSTLAMTVTCNCPIRQCVDFATLSQGPLPPMGALLAGIAQLTVVLPGRGSGPTVTNTRLRMFAGTVLFRLNPGLTIDNLVIRYRRQDSETPLEQVTVTLEDGTTPPPISAPQGFAQGPFEIACPFQGIREWLLTGGAETSIAEMCFEADFQVGP